MAEDKIKTDAENKEILKDAQANPNDEQLSKDELEAVAGGARARTLEDKNFGPVPEMPIHGGNCQYG